MLYDTVGPALLATLEPDQFQSTLQLSVSFLRPVRPGRIVGKGRVVHRDGDIVSLEATLTDPRRETHEAGHGHRHRPCDRPERGSDCGLTASRRSHGHCDAAPRFVEAGSGTRRCAAAGTRGVSSGGR